LRIDKASLFYSLKASRLQISGAEYCEDRHFQALQVFELR
jgi:hypothetical protein